MTKKECAVFSKEKIYVNRERMVEEFISLTSIDSVSRDERRMADALIRKLEAMGYKVIEDGAAKKIGGSAGNLICTVKGAKSVPAVLLSAHMDTVEPGIGKKPAVDGDYIRSDGTTVLGGDDVSGVICILEALRILKEKNIEHGDIQIVFTADEESGLQGSKSMDFSRIYAKYGVVLDSDGAIGTTAIKAPAQINMYVTVKGKASHAGMAPEKGISAIQIAAAAISGMKLGRIDSETTANVGVINGGLATNIVCDRVEIKAEARSREQKKLDLQVAHMKECFEKAAEAFEGSVDFSAELAYPSFNISEDARIISILRKSAVESGVELILKGTGGGSDTNIYNGNGIESVNISAGMDKVHTVEEQILIDDLVKAAEFLICILENIE